MLRITKYRAEDGAEFDTKKKCAEYEALCESITTVMKNLPARPDDIEFSNGAGYLQHEEKAFHVARIGLLQIANNLYPHDWFATSIIDKSIHSSWAGRLIGEMSRPLYQAWHRVECTDSQLREWGQPYYAAHPEQGKQKCLNP